MNILPKSHTMQYLWKIPTLGKHITNEYIGINTLTDTALTTKVLQTEKSDGISMNFPAMADIAVYLIIGGR